MAKSVKEKLMDDVKPEQEEPEKDVKQQPSVDQLQPDANQQSQQEIVINGNFSVCFFFCTNSCRVFLTTVKLGYYEQLRTGHFCSL
jgi:hypothetical protein